MLTSTIALVAAAAGFAVALPNPAVKRQAITDADILNYALTLEHLEDKFYREGLANYTQAQFVAAGFPDPFYANLKTVSSDESTHVAFLTSALQAAGATPVAECTYDFGVSDPKSFVALASVLEGVGVSAYLGAAASIMSKTYLTDAGSILTVESRHSAYIRASLGESPFPQPFDDPLDFDEVYTLAAPFIVSCPSSNPPLPVKAFPMLAVGTTGTISTGTTVSLTTPGTNLVSSNGTNAQLYGAFITVTGPIFVPATTSGSTYSVTVPKGVCGQSYVVLTACNETVTDDTVAAGPAILEITC